LSSDSQRELGETDKHEGFGTKFAPFMTLIRYENCAWSHPETQKLGPLPLHPASHVFHYGSSCFEGLKAFLMPDGSTRVFRLDRHLRRFEHSAELIGLPFPDLVILQSMVRETVRLCRNSIPLPPGALYLRPTLIGTESNIGAAGAASKDAMLFIIASPVGDYFSSKSSTLRIKIEERAMRTTPGFGEAKAGANYASALRFILDARENFQADQVLFCPDGDVQETGASNFLLINDEQILTKPVTDDFLDGVTRDSVLRLAKKMGYEVIEQNFTVSELKEWIKTGEAALSGTAAVLSGVGSFIHQNRDLVVGDGCLGVNTMEIAKRLRDIQSGRAHDCFSWLSDPVT